MSLVDYLPHASKIVMIDEVLEFEIGKIRTRTFIGKDNIFLRDGKLEAYKTIEMIAQSLGIYDSKLRELKGMKSGLGFLLGSRKFEMFLPYLSVGDTVEISAACSIQDESGFGVYDCELYINGELGVRASLNVISPDDEFIKKVLDE